VFFDGTDNNEIRDRELVKDEATSNATNVTKLKDNYYEDALKTYITGIGSEGGWDSLCLAFGCGMARKERQASQFLYDQYNNNLDKLLIVDLVGFSRGAATVQDYGNRIYYGDNIINIPVDSLSLRSEIVFDTVASTGWPGNNFDFGKDFSTPKDVVVIQAVAADEKRMNFGLQSIYNKDGSNPSPNNWIQMIFPGVHSDIGGGYVQGEQNKTTDISKYVLNWTANQANQMLGETVFNIPNTSTYQPSQEFNNLMQQRDQAIQNNNQSALSIINKELQEKYIHDSVIWYHPAHWRDPGDRDVYYPNDKE
jgi:uncharacterized protein (DUF2235 family)